MKKVLAFIAGIFAVSALFAGCKESEESDSIVYGEPSAMIFWQEVEGVSGYEIACIRGKGIAEEDYISVSAEKNYYEFTDLVNNATYTYYVRGVKEDGSKTSPVTGSVVANKSGPSLNVMAYFLDSASTLEEQSLHLAVTTDGLNWQALNGNKPVFTLSTIGGNRVRDPYIVKKADGTYLMIATDWTLYQNTGKLGNHRLYDGTISEEDSWNYETNSYWDVNTTCLIFADSDDMITWKNERQIQLVSDEAKKAFYEKNSNYQFCWAPEVVQNNGKVIHTVDGTGYKYGVIWSGQGETDGTKSKSWNNKTKSYDYTYGHGTKYRRTFVNWTNDFETFTEPEVYFNPGNSNIDADVCDDGNGNFYIFYKDEFNVVDNSNPNITVRSGGYYTLCENKSTSLSPNSFNFNYVFNWNINYKTITKQANIPVYYNQGEGMFCFRPYKNQNLWYCVLDAHDAGKEKVFALYQTTDFNTWTQKDNTSWPEGSIRHGSSVTASVEQISSLVKEFGF